MTKMLDLPDNQFPDFFWTLDRYHQAIEKGVLTEDDKVELLYGKIVELMPAGTPHAECVSLLAEFFRDRFGKEYRYREEKPVTITERASEPEPDLVVVKKQSYGANHPGEGDILFVAEVAQASLERDRTIKVKLYAEANLQEYWIINLRKRKIEVYLQPDPEQGLYASMNHYAENVTFNSPFAGEVIVADLLPEKE